MTTVEATLANIEKVISDTTERELSRGTKRRARRALVSGVPPKTVETKIGDAAKVAQQEQRRKVGGFGGQRDHVGALEDIRFLTEVQNRHGITQGVRLRIGQRMRSRRRGW